MNPKDRYTAEQALNHEWIKNKAPTGERCGAPAMMTDRENSSTEINKTFSFYVSPMSIVDLLIHEMPDPRSCLVSSAHKAIGF